MSLTFKIIMLLSPLIFSTCNNDNSVESEIVIPIDGRWIGSFDGKKFNANFIESNFNGLPILTGSAYIIKDTTTLYFMIVNGRRPSNNEINFQLNETLFNGIQEQYLLTGTMRGDTINGSFSQFEIGGNHFKNGNWRLQKSL